MFLNYLRLGSLFDLSYIAHIPTLQIRFNVSTSAKVTSSFIVILTYLSIPYHLFKLYVLSLVWAVLYEISILTKQ